MLFEQLAKPGAEFLGVKYPIMAGGMTWISNFALVKAVSEEGGFPVLAGGNMPVELLEAEIDRCIAELPAPFAVNLITIAPSFKAQYEMLLAKQVPVVIFAGSFPRKADIQGMKQAGKRTLSFASEGSIAEQQIRFGIDGLILEGHEAGGHIGHVSLVVLLQQVLFEYSQVPIFVAGGIAHGVVIIEAHEADLFRHAAAQAGEDPLEMLRAPVVGGDDRGDVRMGGQVIRQGNLGHLVVGIPHFQRRQGFGRCHRIQPGHPDVEHAHRTGGSLRFGQGALQPGLARQADLPIVGGGEDEEIAVAQLDEMAADRICRFFVVIRDNRAGAVGRRDERDERTRAHHGDSLHLLLDESGMMGNGEDDERIHFSARDHLRVGQRFGGGIRLIDDEQQVELGCRQRIDRAQEGLQQIGILVEGARQTKGDQAIEHRFAITLHH